MADPTPPREDDLASRRAARDVGTFRTCPSCGGAWWNVQAVAIGLDDRVMSYAAPVSCRGCGHVLLDGATKPADLALAQTAEHDCTESATCWPMDEEGPGRCGAVSAAQPAVETRPIADHPWTPGKFSGRCQVMLARYRCPYDEFQHQPAETKETDRG